MHMIRHEAEAGTSDPRIAQIVAEEPNLDGVVVGRGEGFPPVDAPLGNVAGDVGRRQQSRHGIS
jgi:hypothetical protein